MPTKVVCSRETVLQLRVYAKQLHTLTEQYQELIDSHVVEFFVKKQWEMFPKSWQAALDGLPPDNLANLLLDQEMQQQQTVWPLSLLAYRAATRALALDPTPTVGDSISIKMDPALKPINLLCRLHVKKKKKHEILRMAEVINSASSLAGTERVVDVGSGHGHLSRLLSFGYGLKVTSIEAVGCHLTGAAKVDKKIKTIIRKRIEKQSNQPIDGIPHTPPQHVECTVHPQITVKEFLNVINNQSANSDNLDQFKNHSRVGAAHPAEGQNSEDILPVKSNETSTISPNHLLHEPQHSDYHARKESSNAFRETDTYEASKLDSRKSGDRSSDTFVIAGLHTCGDLAPTMLRVFSKCAQARALTSVACCYMKMKCALPGEAAPLPSAEAQETVQNGISRKRSHSPSSQDSSTSDDSHDILESSSETTNLNSDSCQMDDNRTLNLKGYPMSEFVQSLGGAVIEFTAMDLGCHFLESYRKKLKASDRNPYLNLHGYRATLEVVIQGFDREMTQCHSGICRIKKAVASVRKPHLKTFQEYAASALEALGIPYEDRHLADLEERYRPEWTNVITYHVLRIMMGPIVESLLLLDRVLYLYEQGIESKLVPVFDADISPRNFVLVAVKDS
ncbi:protein RRNAD1 isoform X2 [Strongylocentrotus purpuratus]|nr:protein RRNAD1 isoform X2 [Strongylocentrotus purpuratus]XP_030832568.1 protein RRNAD1 isoform X2 [Strongylocentrotus purpuratus]